MVLILHVSLFHGGPGDQSLLGASLFARIRRVVAAAPSPSSPGVSKRGTWECCRLLGGGEALALCVCATSILGGFYGPLG